MKSIFLSLVLVGASLMPGLASAQAINKRLASTEPTMSDPEADAPRASMPNSIVAETAIAPPAPLPEIQPAEHHHHAVWTPGYWSWESSRFVWNAGRFRSPPREGVTWITPRWTAQTNGWALTAGGWGTETVSEPPPFVAQPGREHEIAREHEHTRAHVHGHVHFHTIR